MSLVGQEWELEVGPLAHGGSCVARHEGRVVFVRHCLPGERVRARVTKGAESSRYLVADAVEVIRADPQRVAPPCRFAGPGGCGGCDFQHIQPSHQRRLKAGVVREQLSRLGGVDLPVTVEPVAGDSDGLRWRTRVSFAVARDGSPGLRRYHSHDVLPVDDCLIAAPGIVATGVLRRRFPGATRVDAVVSSTGQAALIEVPNRIKRTPTLREQVRIGQQEAEFRINARTFWQVHPGAAEVLARTVLEQLDPRAGQRALDLYAGAGLFARGLAERVGPDGAVLVVEENPRSAAAAQRWSVALPQVEVRAERVDRALVPLLDGGDRVDLAVLDPPRAGAGREVVARLCALGPRAVSYVACDPASLGRDVGYFRDGGYRLQQVRAFDIYPMTHHVECVALLVPEPGD